MRQPSPAYKAGVYLLAVSYFAIAIITLLPKSPLQARLARLVFPISQTFNLSQNWKLFSPELREINFYSQAIVDFADGSSKLYEFPRLEQMNRWDAYRRQKLCKLFQDSMPWPEFSVFWPDVARYIAKANFAEDNPPVQITLSYNWAKTRDVEHYEKQAELREPNQRFTYFIYSVTAEDLK